MANAFGYVPDGPVGPGPDVITQDIPHLDTSDKPKRKLIYDDSKESQWRSEVIENQSTAIHSAVNTLVDELGLGDSDGAGLREKLRTTLADWSSRGVDDTLSRIRRERDGSARSEHSYRSLEGRSRSPSRGGRGG